MKNIGTRAGVITVIIQLLVDFLALPINRIFCNRKGNFFVKNKLFRLIFFNMNFKYSPVIKIVFEFRRFLRLSVGKHQRWGRICGRVNYLQVNYVNKCTFDSRNIKAKQQLISTKLIAAYFTWLKLYNAVNERKYS